MAKIAVTPTIVLAEFMFFRKTVSYQKVINSMAYKLILV